MPAISATVITFNEEKNIGRCLDSLAGVADEIVVVDSYSTDRTAEICSRYDIRFVQNEFPGHIQQKNFAVSLTSHPLVLSLDADEVLSPELRSSILHAKENWKYDGYYFQRLNNYCGEWIRHTSWYPDFKLRLWDKRKGRWGGLNPHDKVEMESGSEISRMKGHLEHYSYSSVSEHITRVNRYSDIAARAYHEKGITSGTFKVIFNPLWKLFREIVVKTGFMQGYYGIVISVILSFETFLKYVKLKQLQNSKP